MRRRDQRGQKPNCTPVGPKTLTGANSQVIQPWRASQRGLKRHEPRTDSTALTQDPRESIVLLPQLPRIARGPGLTDSRSVILAESSEEDPLMEDETRTNKILEPEKQKHIRLPSSGEAEEDPDINNQTESTGRETQEHKKRPRPDKSISPSLLQQEASDVIKIIQGARGIHSPFSKLNISCHKRGRRKLCTCAESLVYTAST